MVTAIASWTPDLLKQHLDELLRERREADETHRAAVEQRFAAVDSLHRGGEPGVHRTLEGYEPVMPAGLQRGEALVDDLRSTIGASIDVLRTSWTKGLDELRRLVGGVLF